MGLLQFIRRLFRGSPGSRGALAPDVPRSADEAATAAHTAGPPRGRALARTRLVPLRYQSSLVRTDPATEASGSEPPYRFAHLSVAGGSYLNLGSDGDARWLAHFGLPPLSTPEELAAFCELPLGKLAWLTHRFDEGGRPASVRQAHYHFHWIRKTSGGHRLIEAPKRSLKSIQRRILRDILNQVPAHDAAHGFVAGRSIRTNAAGHVGRRVVIKFDLANFYPSVRYSRVVAIFRSLGYPREIALWLARLTTAAIPAGMSFPEGDAAAVRTYYPRHLPQGAPTSPALANLSAYGLDVRLSGLAKSYKVQYSRYADDLSFSGPHTFIPALSEFIPLVEAIVRDERFTVHWRKRQVLRNNQRQVVAGVVVNSKPNIARPDYDRLKAILHNCRLNGPSSQNCEHHPAFADHLLGRIAHVAHLNPARGARLRAMYDQIDWSR